MDNTLNTIREFNSGVFKGKFLYTQEHHNRMEMFKKFTMELSIPNVNSRIGLWKVTTDFYTIVFDQDNNSSQIKYTHYTYYL